MDDNFPAAGHVTGTKMPKATGRLQRKSISGAGSTVDEVGVLCMETPSVDELEFSRCLSYRTK